MRTRKGLTLTELATEAGISKAYLSQIENGQVSKPSAQTLYRISRVLGTSVAALLGEITHDGERRVRIPKALDEFAQEQQLDEDDVQMLARIRFRGRQPRTADDWRFLYEALKRSTRTG